MQVVITGGGGFLGLRLAKKLLQKGQLNEQPIEKLILCDVARPEAMPTDARLEFLAGEFGQPAILRRIAQPETSFLFHLAAIVSGGAEEDFDLGMRVNLHDSMALLEALRASKTSPRVVFASTVAAFGGDLPRIVSDQVAVTPQTSYGTQKAIVELLLNDYTRRGFLDGRALRLPTIVVRPGKPNKALSSFASSLIREPLMGRAYACPVPLRTSVFVLSPRQVIESFIHAAELPTRAWASFTATCLPGLQVTVREMLDSLREIAGEAVVERVSWEPDPAVQKVVFGWPTRFSTLRARCMGFVPDASLASIIQGFIEDELGGQFVA